ncbi:MAG: polysaccharide deacetylase family protein [Lachnospiraceae bacterium]
MYKWSNEWKRKGFYAILILFCGCCFIGISKKTKETEGEIQQKESVEESGVKEKPSIAITFDDGPSSRYTGRLLDGLKERNVKASFFLIGENAEESPVLVERIYKEGHLIGNHTYSHVQMTHLSEEAAVREIEKTDQVISAITGEHVAYMRPPFGAWQRELEVRMEVLPVLWSVDPLDWTTENVDEIVSKVVTEVEEGDIILLHDCYASSVEAALRIVDILQKEGYEFVTVDRLLID